MPPHGIEPSPQQELLATIGVALYSRPIKTKEESKSMKTIDVAAAMLAPSAEVSVHA